MQVRADKLEADSSHLEEYKEELEEKIAAINETTQNLAVEIVGNTQGNAQMAEKVDRMDERIQKLLDETATQAQERNDHANKITMLTNKIRQFESQKTYFDSVLIMKDKVNELLSKRITHLEQYTRRYSVVIKGVQCRENEVREGRLEEEVRNLLQEANSATTFDDVDKFHRNGPRYEDNQDLLIRFKSHSAKEKFYRARKTIKRAGVKVQPSLSPESRSLLEKAKEELESYNDVNLANPPDFVMADLHGNLWVKFQHETHEKSIFYRFDSLEKLMGLIDLYNTDQTVLRDNEEESNGLD